MRKHNVYVSALADRPQHISSPIFVFQRGEDAIGIPTDMKDRDGNNVCVAIELKRKIEAGNEILEVNDIRSVHGRNMEDIVYPILSRTER